MNLREFITLDFFAALFRAEQGIERAEARNVLRSLRAIYFFPDQSISILDRISESKGEDIESIDELSSLFNSTQAEVSESVLFLTSESVKTNLRIPIEVLHEIREATSMKKGLRAKFTSMFIALEFERDFAKIAEIAEEAKIDIISFNERLQEIEKLVSANG